MWAEEEVLSSVLLLCNIQDDTMAQGMAGMTQFNVGFVRDFPYGPVDSGNGAAMNRTLHHLGESSGVSKYITGKALIL